MNMQGQVVLITGAKGGLGSFVTEKFLKEGATVVGASRSIKQSDFSGSNFTAIAAEFSDADAVRNLVEQVIARFGRIDVLAHVAGGFAGGKSVAETDDKTWEQMLDMNLTSAYHTLHSVIPHMRKAKYGRIVAVGSLSAVDPHPALSAYVVSKMAMAALVRTVALENADANVTANVVLPGTMDTLTNRSAMPDADFSKWLAPADVANLIHWLSTKEAGHITGALVPINGQ